MNVISNNNHGEVDKNMCHKEINQIEEKAYDINNAGKH